MTQTQSDGLRERRLNTVINDISKYQDAEISKITDNLVDDLNNQYKDNNLTFYKTKKITIGNVHEYYGTVHNINIGLFDKTYSQSEMKPDGGIIWMIKENKHYPILICEKKHQGTNDKRLMEGKGKQARGNAIERLGKNLDGFDLLYGFDDIFPVIVFGDGCDFEETSTILGRISVMNYTFKLNVIDIDKEIVKSQLNNKTIELRKCVMMFREKEWTSSEMLDIMLDVIHQSIKYFLQNKR